MENNENEVQNQDNLNADNGYTQAPDMQGSNIQQPVYMESQSTQTGMGLAIAGMVLGILSIVCCCFSPFNVIFAIIGLILSIVSLIQKKPGKGMAIAGIICSAVAIVFLVVCIAVIGGVSTSNGDFMEEFQKGFEQGYNATSTW